jgi:hypothetical protein
VPSLAEWPSGRGCGCLPWLLLASPNPGPGSLIAGLTAVSLAIQAQAHPKDIQAMAGHSFFQVTMDVYGHLLPGRGKELADRMALLWWANGGQEAAGRVIHLKKAEGESAP